MNLTSGVQEALITLSCYDDHHDGGGLVFAFVNPKQFDPYYREIAQEVAKYRDQYKKAPGDHTYDILEALKENRPDDAEVYDKIFGSMYATKDGLNRAYVLAKAQAFQRNQRLKIGLTRAVDLLQHPTEASVSEAESVLLESLKGTTDLFRVGTEFTDVSEALKFFDEVEPALPTGIPQLDRYNLGPAPGTLHLFMALPNRGKTWYLVNLAKHAMMQGKTVVHLTLEMSEPKIAQRYVQALFSVSKRQTAVNTTRFQTDELGRFTEFDVEKVTPPLSFNTLGIRRTLSKKIRQRKGRGRLIIRQFPSGQLTVKETGHYLDCLEARGVLPDLVIVDYADLMSVSSDNLRVDLGRLYVGLRGLAVERNVAIATATQANRSAETARLLTRQHLAEDFSKVATVDTMITYSQTQDERELGLARLYVDKARDDVNQFTTLISQCYELGQFCLDSAGMVSKYWSQVEDAVVEED